MDVIFTIFDWIYSKPKILGAIVIVMGISMFFIETEPGIHDVTFAPLFFGLGIFLLVSRDPFGNRVD